MAIWLYGHVAIWQVSKNRGQNWKIRRGSFNHGVRVRVKVRIRVNAHMKNQKSNWCDLHYCLCVGCDAKFCEAPFQAFVTWTKSESFECPIRVSPAASSVEWLHERLACPYWKKKRTDFSQACMRSRWSWRYSTIDHKSFSYAPINALKKWVWHDVMQTSFSRAQAFGGFFDQKLGNKIFCNLFKQNEAKTIMLQT